MPYGVHISRVHHILHLHTSAYFALAAVFDTCLLRDVEFGCELLSILILEDLQFRLSCKFRGLKLGKWGEFKTYQEVLVDLRVFILDLLQMIFKVLVSLLLETLLHLQIVQMKLFIIGSRIILNLLICNHAVLDGS